MEKLLVLENIRFVILLFGSMTFGSMAWLYFDATEAKKQLNVWLSGVGSLLIAASFLLNILGVGYAEMVRYLGYLLLGIGVWIKPMSAKPVYENETKVANAVLLPELASWSLTLLPGFVGLGYFRLVILGLEKHLLKLGIGMYFLMFAEILGKAKMFSSWSDPRVYLATADYGVVWILQLVVLGVGLYIISTWVFSYLLKRFETQLTLFLCSMTIFAFAVATVGFTFVTANNIKDRFLKYQKMTLELLRFSEESRGAEMVLRAKDFGSMAGVVKLLNGESGEDANKEMQELQKNGGYTSIRIVSADGRNLLSTSDSQVGDWAIFSKAVKNEPAWGYESESGVLSLSSASPVVGEGSKVLGVVVLSKKIDSNYLDQIAKKVTSGLWVYKQNKVVSFADNDDKIRLLIGFEDTSKEFTESVLSKGQDLTRENVEILGENYMGVWGAVKNTNGSTLGSLAVVSRVDELWKIVSEALVRDYQLAVLSLLFSLLPAVMISRYFVKQLV